MNLDQSSMRHDMVRAEGPTSPLDQLLALPLVERVDIPPRPAQFTSAPTQFSQGALGTWLKCSLGALDRLYLHQGLAFAAIEQDLNVVVSTATASGKSLVFMGAALRKILGGKSRVLVFYTQKALGSDQLGRWQRELQNAGLPAEWIGEINGDVPISEREAVLIGSRIVLATPDVIHAWLMPGLSSPGVQRFIQQLDLLILDEAHALEAVFGSHTTLFLRRLRLARRLSIGVPPGPASDFQVVAATATLSDPMAHLHALTGLQFVLVGENDNGAPRHGLTVLHLEGPDIGATAEKLCADVVERITDSLNPGAAMIAFADSRQGVERVIRRVGKKNVLPYRSGYTRADRRAIEAMLHKQQLLGVIATSALELGIDLPQFTHGVTMGVPPSRKSLRQRIGRIGRVQAGVFAVIAPRTAFAQLGTSLAEYVSGPVEDSPLYSDNPFIQYQHARCMVEEGSFEGWATVG
ncbi:MAG: DEAD/DEAH box helicase, partial [Novosphingobium sp.]